MTEISISAETATTLVRVLGERALAGRPLTLDELIDEWAGSFSMGVSKIDGGPLEAPWEVAGLQPLPSSGGSALARIISDEESPIDLAPVDESPKGDTTDAQHPVSPPRTRRTKAQMAEARNVVRKTYSLNLFHHTDLPWQEAHELALVAADSRAVTVGLSPSQGRGAVATDIDVQRRQFEAGVTAPKPDVPAGPSPDNEGTGPFEPLSPQAQAVVDNGRAIQAGDLSASRIVADDTEDLFAAFLTDKGLED